MITRLKRHNDSMFLVLLLILLSTSAWFFTHNMSSSILFLKGEVVKIDNQNLSFTKQILDIMNSKNQIQGEIDNFLTLQSSIQENKTEDVKQELAKNTKSHDLLSILPPSEIANIQQTESHKKITEELIVLKDKSATLWKSISNLGNENFSDTQFSIGNISDISLKNALYADLTVFLKKEKELFSTVISYDNSFDKFTQSTDNLNQVYPLLKIAQAKNKKFITDKVDSLSKELEMIEIISVVGLVSLLLLLVFVVSRKKKVKVAVKASHLQVEDFEPTVYGLTVAENVLEITLYDKALSLINTINQQLNKQITLHFDMDNFESLTVDQKDKLTNIVLELVKFSGIYSFDTAQTGDIIISLKDNNGTHTFISKDNGKGLYVETIKEQIKAQYKVPDAVFVGKTDQQIFSFIFKPGFKLIAQNENSNIEQLQLSLVSQLAKEMNAKMSLATQEHSRTEFMIEFQSI